MKRCATIFVLIVSLLAPAALLHAEQVRVLVKGMVCAFCVQGVKKSLEADEAVKAVQLNLTDKIATITLKDGAHLDDKAIRGIIKDSGFEVEKIYRDSPPSSKKPAQKKIHK